MHGRPFVMLVIMRGRVQAFVIQQRSYENLRRRSKHSTLSSSHGMPITNTWPSVSWRRGFRVEQFEIGSLAGQCGSKRQIVGLEEIVAAGHDEQWRQVDVERQAFGGEELRVGGFDAVEEFDAQHLFESGAAIRIVAYGQFASLVSNDAEL